MSTHTSTDKGAEAEREVFERHYVKNNEFAWRDEDGKYKNYQLQFAWEVWQAARRAPAPVADGLPPLPALPREWGTLYAADQQKELDGFTADQMRGYAIDYANIVIAASQARASVPAAGAVQQPVAWGCKLDLAFKPMETPDIAWGHENPWNSDYEPFPLYAAPAPGNTAQPVEQVGEQPADDPRDAASEHAYNPSHLLDVLLGKMQLKNDHALARMLEVAPAVIGKIRRQKAPVGASLLIRMSNVTGISIRDLRDLMGDRREKYRLSDVAWTDAARAERLKAKGATDGAEEDQ